MDKFYGGAIRAGQVDVSTPVTLLSSTGAPVTLVASGAVTAEYWREGETVQSVLVTALGALNGAHVDGGWFEAGNGRYRFDWPDAAFAPGADWVQLRISVSGALVWMPTIPLTSTVPQAGDSFTRLGAPRGASISEDLNAGVLDSGTLQAGTVSSLTLRAAAPAGIFPARAMIVITSGPAQGETAIIDAYDSVTKVVTPRTNFTNAPGAATYFVVATAPSEAATAINVTELGGSTAAVTALRDAAIQGLALASGVNVTEINGDQQAALDLVAALASGIASPGDAMTLTTGERTALEAALFDKADGVETGLTQRQLQRVLAAFLTGLVSGATTSSGPATVVFRNRADTLDRITITGDEAGNRTSVVLNLA